MSDSKNPMDILAALEETAIEGDNEEVVDEVGEGSEGHSQEGGEEDGEGSGVREEGELGEAGSVEEESESQELILGKFKSPEDLAAAYQEVERKMHEATTSARERELMLQQYAQQFQQQNQQPQPFASGQPQNMQELENLIYDDPETAVMFVAEQAPHLMNKVLATVRQFDPEAAEDYSLWYQDYKMEQRLAQMQQPIQNMQAKTLAQQAFQSIATLPEYQILRADIAKIVQERPYWFNVGNPEGLANALKDAYELAKSRNIDKINATHKAANQKRNEDASANAQGVERGGHTPANDVDLEEEDPAVTLRNSILEVAKLGS